MQDVWFIREAIQSYNITFDLWKTLPEVEQIKIIKKWEKETGVRFSYVDLAIEKKWLSKDRNFIHNFCGMCGLRSCYSYIDGECWNGVEVVEENKCDTMPEENIPPTLVRANGDKEWYSKGKLHRTNGPAIEYANGSKFWYQEGQLHRTDGPASICANGDKEWRIRAKLHRLDGPAVMYSNGKKEWWIDGVLLTESEWQTKIALSLVGR